ncbi:hypothetical protein ACFO4L_04910 [Bacillus daqingensis]|uniref:DUF4233 domain-containing protein n=1 Tax=Bacillus daqingensis TaxID=872396 RepID=A0ABV9NSP6_9BACI
MERTVKAKYITGACEAFLGIPILGGMFILTLSWVPLMVMFVAHFLVLLLVLQDNRSKVGPVFGLVTSAVGWIPFVGMIMHIVTAVLLITEAARENKMHAVIDMPKQHEDR